MPAVWGIVQCQLCGALCSASCVGHCTVPMLRSLHNISFITLDGLFAPHTTPHHTHHTNHATQQTPHTTPVLCSLPNAHTIHTAPCSIYLYMLLDCQLGGFVRGERGGGQQCFGQFSSSAFTTPHNTTPLLQWHISLSSAGDTHSAGQHPSIPGFHINTIYLQSRYNIPTREVVFSYSFISPQLSSTLAHSFDTLSLRQSGVFRECRLAVQSLIVSSACQQ